MEKSPDKGETRRRLAPKGELQLEQEWLAASLRDPENFQFFYDKYADRIHRFIRTRTGDEELARDLTALVFTKALGRLAEFQWQGYTLGAWLFRIATNEIRKHFQSEGRLNTVGGDETPDLAADPQNGQLDSIILTEAQQFIFQCLHNLSEQDQDIFILHYWEGQKTRQVAETLHLSENTVKTRLARGRERLRSMMEPSRQGPARPGEDGPDPDLRFAQWAPPASPPKEDPRS